MKDMLKYCGFLSNFMQSEGTYEPVTELCLEPLSHSTFMKDMLDYCGFLLFRARTQAEEVRQVGPSHEIVVLQTHCIVLPSS
jgi:hypothetical protein